MLYSLFVHTLLLLLMYLPATKIARSHYSDSLLIRRPEFHFILLAFSLIVGLRWDVGTDYPNYYDIYTGLRDTVDRLELIPRMLMTFGTTFGLPYYYWFIVMAYIQIFFVVYGTALTYRKALPYAILFYLTFFLNHDFNIVRQAAAYSIVYFAFCQLIRGKAVESIIWIVISFFFHKSALIAAPFLFLIYVHKFPNKYIQLIGYVVVTILLPLVTNALVADFGIYLGFLGGETYAERILNDEMGNKEGTGLGVMFLEFIFAITIFMSDKILTRDQKLLPLYIMFFMGASFYMTCMADQYLVRIDQYFSFFVVLFAAVAVCLLKQSKFTVLAYMATIGSTLLFLMSSLSREWMFVWDK